jgi:hypothetical protein
MKKRPVMGAWYFDGRCESAELEVIGHYVGISLGSGFTITRPLQKHARLDLTLMLRGLDRLTRMGCLYTDILGLSAQGFSVLDFHEVPRCYSGQATLSGGITANCLHRRRYAVGRHNSRCYPEGLCTCLLVSVSRSGCSLPSAFGFRSSKAWGITSTRMLHH